MTIYAHGQEDLFNGYDQDNVATPTQESKYIQGFLNKSMQAENRILVTDYCSTPANMLDSYEQNEAAGYVSFAADERNRITISSCPNTIWQASSSLVTSLPIVQNFLYLLNSENYPSKTNFINQGSTAYLIYHSDEGRVSYPVCHADDRKHLFYLR